MKEASWITYSFDVKLEGKGACRLTDKMFHNHQNTVNMAGEVQAMLAMAAREGDIYFLCYLLCQESLKPNPRQENIAKELDALDEASGGASPYKAEVPYNMRQSPPGHIPKDWTFPEYLKMRFYQPPKRRPEPLIQSWKDYKSGNVKDDIKIPDVSILNDPKQPPAGTNIRAVAEMKLRDDPTQFGTDTAKANERFYRRIATQDGTNPDGEYLALDAQTCGCAEGKPVLVPELQEANERLKKRVPQPAPAPVAEPSGGWLPTPSPAFVQGLSGVGQMLGGGVLMIGSGIAAGALVADDLTGIGVVDDALIPVAAAGAVGGAALFSNGAKMFMGAFGF
jgi:hypothetical protein